jgi:transcriptional regulator with GAF, ATPase, and Fis domain/tetratricopeptide (TPR) repeat protein
VQRAIPPDQAQLDASVRRDALDQHEAIGDLHFAADHFAGAVEQYVQALDRQRDGAPLEQVRLLLKLAEAEFARSAFQPALSALARAREIARPLRDSRVNATIVARLANALIEVGRYRAALRYAQYAYQVLRDTDEHRIVGQLGVTLGFCYARIGRAHEAIDWLQSAAATFRRIGDTDGLVMALNNLGLVYKNLREWREAIRFLEQALRLDERAGLYARLRPGLQNLGLIRYRLGQWDLAEENFRQSLKIARETGHKQGEAGALLALGMLARRRRQSERAEEHFRMGHVLAVEADAPREALLAREFLGELALDRGDSSGAIALFEPALEEATALAPEGDVAAELHTRLGLAYLGAGRLEDAQASLMQGAILSERLGDRIEQAIAERSFARLEAMRGNAAAVEAKIRSAAQCFESLNETYELGVTLVAWAENMLMLPASVRLRVELDPVAEAARRAAALFRQLGIVGLAAESLITLARLEAERERFDQSLSLLEHAESWLGESGDADAEERAETLRRDLERQYVAVSLSTCNEFRALEDANRLFRETCDMEGLLSSTVKLAVEHTGGDRGFVAFSNGGGRLDVVAQHGLGRDRARKMLRALEHAAGNRIAESGPLFSSRVTADPRFGAAVADSLEGVGSLVCVPLNFPSQSVGLVYVDRLNDSLLGAFRQRELNLLAVLSNSAAVAIVEAQRSLLLAENKELRGKLKPSPAIERVVTQSREMQNILSLLQKVGDSSATILFMGETGTGKGLLAQVVHEISNRRDRPFVQVNCAALPEQLLESELFGYVHGAFTGALRDKAGLFEEAEFGTIFLDEIEKVPESVQAKLLHVLDRSEIRPVGATRSRRVDARVICATGVDLRERIKMGRFLEDLYYRLNDITVRVPALRERREDVAVLAQHFLEFYGRQMDKAVRGFTPEVMKLFLAHEWRGNVRELEKAVKRLVVLAEEGGVLGLELLPQEILDGIERLESNDDSPTNQSLRSSISQLERRMIAQALERNRWNRARAARELGLSYPTLLAKIRLLRIEPRQTFH